MGWGELIDKTVYWLKLRRLRKEGGVKPAPVPPGPGIPLEVAWEKVCSFERESYKVSACMPLEGGALVCSYNNAERGTSRLFRCGTDGSRQEIWKGGEETVGQGYLFEGQWFLPVEKPNGDILAVPFDGSSCKAVASQGGQYAARIVDGRIGVGNQLFEVGSTSPVATFPRLSGILCGLVHVGDEWIASDDEHGIMSSNGWFISCKCPDLAVVCGKVLAFLRSGEVRIIEGEDLGRTIGTTHGKCRRAWSDGKRCWWTTAPSDGLCWHSVWVTDAESIKVVGNFEGKAEPTPAANLGSLFGSAICEADDGTLWLAISNKTEDGWELYRGTPTYPAPEPEPTPEPAPAPEPEPTPEPAPAPEPEPSDEDFTPPERTGADSYVGNGAFNTFLDVGRATESSHKLVTIEGWFKAKSWTGGGSAQAAGFCFAFKGLVGKRGGLMASVRPDSLVWNATGGEIVAPCTVPLNEWHHFKCIATPDAAKFWLDGKLLKSGEKKFSGALCSDTPEPLLIGGYMCPWPKATFYNQSIDGEISDWKVEME